MTIEELQQALNEEVPVIDTKQLAPLPELPAKTVLRYTNEKSDKFWQCECIDTALMVNYGKWRTSGRYEIKCFSTAEECQRQAQKLIASKKKKGYAETADLEENGHLYFDDREFGISPITSHPVFRQYCTSEFYYDCVNDYAPFGNDTGFDILYAVEDYMRKEPRFRNDNYANHYMVHFWHLPCIAPINKNLISDEELISIANSDYEGMIGSDVMLLTNQTVIAAVLGKFKIKGSIEKYEAIQLFRSLDRMERLWKLMHDNPADEALDIINTIRQNIARYTHDRYDGQYFSLVKPFDEFWVKVMSLHESRGRKAFDIPDDIKGKALAERVYKIVEELTGQEEVPDGFKNADELFDSLGALLGQAVCDHYGWKWIKLGEPDYCGNDGFFTTPQFFAVVSPDESFCFIPIPLIVDIIFGNNIGLDGENENTILLLFNMIEKVHEMLGDKKVKYFPIT